jgi:hypothetical protein
MRWSALLLLCCLSFTGFASSRTRSAALSVPDSLLVGTNWRETSPGARSGYLLVLTDIGNFEEDAGPDHERPYQYLMGRWRLDSATQVFTFSVDGQMGKTGVHSRYKRGRDFYLDYDLLVLNATTLELRDHLTGEHRTFRAEARLNYVEPAIRRIPKPADEGRFKLPGSGGNWGGIF